VQLFYATAFNGFGFGKTGVFCVYLKTLYTLCEVHKGR